LKEKDIIICRCEEVRLSEIRRAIENGATTIAEVKRMTRAGMGLCQGRTCARLVATLISKYTGKPMKDILPATFRAPVRTIKLGSLGGEKNCYPEKQKL